MLLRSAVEMVDDVIVLVIEIVVVVVVIVVGDVQVNLDAAAAISPKEALFEQ